MASNLDNKALISQLVPLRYARTPVKDVTKKLSISVTRYTELVNSDAYRDAYETFLRQVQRDAIAICRAQSREIAEEAIKQLMKKVKEGNMDAIKTALRDVIGLSEPEMKTSDTNITIQLPTGLDIKDVPNETT